MHVLLSVQTLYAQVQVSKIGSLAYAEDDGSHVIGFKVADPFDGDRYACHVVECSSEVCGLGRWLGHNLQSKLSTPVCDTRWNWNHSYTKLVDVSYE